MKELDFLPHSYKKSRKWQISIRNRYLAIVGVVVLLVGWNVAIVRDISNINSRNNSMESQMESAMRATQEHEDLRRKLNILENQKAVLQSLNSTGDIVGIFGELSYLLSQNIVLNKVAFEQEPLNQSRNGDEYKLAGAGHSAVGDAVEPVRYKISIQGIAASAGDVADFIRRMERSAYFTTVYPAYSRNKSISPAGDKNKFEVSEFEIACYLANYKEKATVMAQADGAVDGD